MAFLGPSLRRKRVTDRPAARVAIAGAISLAVNAALVLVLAYAGAFELSAPVKSERVELAPLSADQWRANRAIESTPTPPAAPEVPAPAPVTPPAPPPSQAEKPPPEQKPRGQVVDVAPGNQRRSDQSRFLAEHDNRVDRETVSRWAGADLYKNRAPAPTPGGERKKARGGQGGADQETQEAREARAAGGGKGSSEKPQTAQPRTPEEDRLAMLQGPQLPQVGPSERWRKGEGDDEGLGAPGPAQEGQQGKRKEGDPRLLPSLESMSKIAGGPSNDYVEGVEKGDATLLNTRGYRFATFWNRFKQDVSDHWFPAVRYDIHARDPEGSVFGRRAWVTGLRIVLDRGGAVKEVEVVEPSGLDFLDRVAVRSVRAAAPFYNVPAGLLDAKGELAFEFGFLVSDERGVPVRPRYTP